MAQHSNGSEAEREPPHHAIDGPYRGAAPLFHDASEVPGLEPVRTQWRTIRDEALGFLAAPGAELGRNFDPYGFDVEGWRSLNLQTYLRRYRSNRRALPKTVALLDRVPGLTSAFLNVLQPRTRIPAHPGDSNTIWRVHLPLVVPGDVDGCGLQVGEERRGWQEGEPLVFCDAHEHQAWNHTDEPRVVLVFDVMKPEYRDERFRICGNVRAAIALTLLETKLRRRLPSPLRAPLHHGLGLGMRAGLHLQALVPERSA